MSAVSHKLLEIASSKASKTALGHKLLFFFELAFLTMFLTAASVRRIRDRSLFGSFRLGRPLKDGSELRFDKWRQRISDMLPNSLCNFMERAVGVKEVVNERHELIRSRK